MKKALYVIIAILLAIVIFFCGVLVTINTQNSLVSKTEETTKQATITSSSTAYITMADHLKETAICDTVVFGANSYNCTGKSMCAMFTLPTGNKYSKLTITNITYVNGGYAVDASTSAITIGTTLTKGIKAGDSFDINSQYVFIRYYAGSSNTYGQVWVTIQLE
jgi:uncharacterized protein YxeA